MAVTRLLILALAFLAVLVLRRSKQDVPVDGGWRESLDVEFV